MMHTEFREASSFDGQSALFAAVQYVVVGHVAKDLTPDGPRLGGTAAYAALTAQALGYPSGLVTACDSDVDLSPLAGAACVRVPSTASTTFENLYSPTGRRQFLRACAAPLALSAFPSAWRAVPIIHIGPIAGEVPAKLVSLLGQMGQFIGLTPQGWLRRWDEAGQVQPAAWPEALATLPLAHAAVLSLEDLQGDWSAARQWAEVAKILVITQGALGCTVFVQGQPAQHLLAPAATEVDPTGAGDVFAAAFFIRLHETRSPYAAAEFANRIAATSVTRPGLAGVPSEIEARFCRGDAE